MRLDEGVSYETLLSVIDSRWIMDHIGNGKDEFMFTFEVPTGNFVQVEKDDGTIEMAPEYKTIESTLTKWRSEGTVTYYFLTSAKPDAEDFMDGVVTYLVANDTATNTMSVYVIGGEDYLEEQGGFAEDSYNEYKDENGNTETVTAEMAEDWKDSVMSDGTRWAQFILDNLVGSTVLDKETPVLDITYVSVNNFLGIEGFTGYYNVTDGKWYYASTSFAISPIDYAEIEFVKASDGVWYLAEGTTFTTNSILGNRTYTLDESVFLTWNVDHTTKYDDNNYYDVGYIG